MSTPTVVVTFAANDQNGNPVSGARVLARLNTTEIYSGFVVPEEVEATTDESGKAFLKLFPNSLGAKSSKYRLRAWNPDTNAKFVDAFISVPNQNCNVTDILIQEPYPEIDASERALLVAQAALADVTNQAGLATAAKNTAVAKANESYSYANSALAYKNEAKTEADKSKQYSETSVSSSSTAVTASDSAKESLAIVSSLAAQVTTDAATATQKAQEASQTFQSVTAKANQVNNTATSVFQSETKTLSAKQEAQDAKNASEISALVSASRAQQIATSVVLTSNYASEAETSALNSKQFKEATQALVTQAQNVQQQIEAKAVAISNSEVSTKSYVDSAKTIYGSIQDIQANVAVAVNSATEAKQLSELSSKNAQLALSNADLAMSAAESVSGLKKEVQTAAAQVVVGLEAINSAKAQAESIKQDISSAVSFCGEASATSTLKALEARNHMSLAELKAEEAKNYSLAAASSKEQAQQAINQLDVLVTEPLAKLSESLMRTQTLLANHLGFN